MKESNQTELFRVHFFKKEVEKRAILGCFWHIVPPPNFPLIVKRSSFSKVVIVNIVNKKDRQYKNRQYKNRRYKYRHL